MPGLSDNNGIRLPVSAAPASGGSVPSDPQPLPPLKPELADCCGDGCARCVFDIYEEALARFEAQLAAWRSRQPQSGDNPNPPSRRE